MCCKLSVICCLASFDTPRSPRYTEGCVIIRAVANGQARFLPESTRPHAPALQKDFFIKLLSLLHKGFLWIKELVARGYAASETFLHRVQSELFRFLRGGVARRFAGWFRTYGAFSLVCFSALLVSMTNVTQEEGSESAVFGRFRIAESRAEEPARKRLAVETTPAEDLSRAPLAEPVSGVDPSARISDDEAVIESGTRLFAQVGRSVARDPEEDGGVSIYTVRQGDTVSDIAERNGITVNTILWANDLDDIDSIHPGDEIFILPVAGLSHKIASGDTIESIAGEYEADRDTILAFNDLPANGEITVGETIIIPGGEKEIPQPEPTIGLRQYASSSSGGTVLDVSGGYRKLEGKAGSGHRFPYGYCTWYVSQRRYVPWGGNAGTWLYHARAMGYKTGKKPKKGAIVVTTDDRYYGHVALVEKVSGGSITVSEMNYSRWGKVNRRTIATGSRTIKGYIY